jgi:hypothetical protein
MIKFFLLGVLAFFVIGFVVMFWAPLLVIGFIWLVWRAFTPRRCRT